MIFNGFFIEHFQSEYDDERIDPHHGNQEAEEAPENMDLPDDLTLDEEEAGVTEEQGQGQNYYPVAIKD